MMQQSDLRCKVCGEKLGDKQKLHGGGQYREYGTRYNCLNPDCPVICVDVHCKGDIQGGFEILSARWHIDSTYDEYIPTGDAMNNPRARADT